jgi:hypothetical protein
MSVFDESDELIRAELRAAWRRAPQRWARPVLPARVLMAGALTGFTAEQAEAILADPDCRVYLNDLWTTYREGTGRAGPGADLPALYQERIDQERAGAGPAWNLLVAHGSGWGYSEEEVEAEWQEAAARQFWEGARLAASYLGGTDEPAEPASEAWDVYLRTQHVLMLARVRGGRLIVQAESALKRGVYDLVLRWEDGLSLSRQVTLRPGHPDRFSLDGQYARLPVSASIKV